LSGEVGEGTSCAPLAELATCAAFAAFAAHRGTRQETAMPSLTGFSHADFTVTDPERSARWWEEVMGFTPIHQFEQETFAGRVLVHCSGVSVGVLRHDTTATESFDERRVGLDHFAFAVGDLDELEGWVRHLDKKGVEHSGVIDAHFGPTLVLRDPDNVQLELFVVAPNIQDLIRSDPASVSS
jgi:glyoxylase I family protein